MPSSLVTITHREAFSAAHRLFSPQLSEEQNRRLYGPCFALHGHNYAVEVSLRGEVDPSTGMVFDLNRLMVMMQEEIVSVVDHKYLNEDVPFLADLIPTAENLAIAFWERLQPSLRSESARLQRVRVLESEANQAEYLGPAESPLPGSSDA
jgi:6-pyruvoyltetrahydropterin/6-carboxytetrahydropterin synthase